MFEKLTFRQKIFASVIVLLLLMTVVGIAGYFGLNSVLTAMDFYRKVNNLQKNTYLVKEHTDKYLIAVYSGESEIQQENVKTIIAALNKERLDIKELRKYFTTGKAAFKNLEDAEIIANKIELLLKSYFPMQEENVELENEIKKTLPDIEDLIEKGLLEIKKMQIAFGNFKGD